MPILPIWPFSLESVPSPAMLRCVSVGVVSSGLPLVSSSASPCSSTMPPLASSWKCPARVSRGPCLACTVNQPVWLPMAMSSGLAVCRSVPGWRSR